MASADFTIAEFLAWVRTKPADERYEYPNRGGCALCQFLSGTGRAERPTVDMYSIDVEGGWSDGSLPKQPYPRELEPALSGADFGDIFGDEKSWTFGALVTRLEKLCPDTPVTPSNWQTIDAYLTDIEAVEIA